MNHDSPMVSIILPTYNGSKYIAESIDSCLNQTYKNIELIIIDDGSTDSTSEIIKMFKDSRIILLKHGKNAGLPRAVNSGMARASGYYLTWTSDDNQYLPTAIEKMVYFLETSGTSFVYCNYYAFYNTDVNHREVRNLPDSPLLKNGNCIGYCFLYKKEVRDVVGDYDPEALLAEDYDYWIRIVKKVPVGHLDEPLYLARYHARSLTTGRFYEAKVVDYLLRLKHGLLTVDEIRGLFLELLVDKKIHDLRFKKLANRIVRKIVKINASLSSSNGIGVVLANYKANKIDFVGTKEKLNAYFR